MSVIEEGSSELGRVYDVTRAAFFNPRREDYNTGRAGKIGVHFVEIFRNRLEDWRTDWSFAVQEQWSVSGVDEHRVPYIPATRRIGKLDV